MLYNVKVTAFGNFSNISDIMIRTTDKMCTGDCQCYHLCVILDIYRARDSHLELVSLTHA